MTSNDTHEALTQLLGTHPKVTILVALLEHSEGITATDIGEQYPLRRETAAQHIGDLQAMNVVVTDEIGTAKVHSLDGKESLVTALTAVADRATEVYDG